MSGNHRRKEMGRGELWSTEMWVEAELRGILFLIQSNHRDPGCTLISGIPLAITHGQPSALSYPCLLLSGILILPSPLLFSDQTSVFPRRLPCGIPCFLNLHIWRLKKCENRASSVYPSYLLISASFFGLYFTSH